MKKFILLIILTILAISSCEKDDICLENTTPMFIIRFNDTDNPTEKKAVNSLTVWAVGKDSLYTNKSLDSIVLPLNLNENNTIFKFRSDEIIDEIDVTYDRKDIFISRSCGFITTFENLQFSSSTNWIKGYSINNTIIENETATHITIFH